MKTPEEIKRGLEACGSDECHGHHTDCPYEDDLLCTMHICGDARAYIQQLENHIGEFTENVAQLEKERNALLADLRDADMLECAHCAHYIPVGAQCEGEGDCLECDYKNCACNGCWGNSNWEWRGVQEGEYVREF